MFRATRMSLNGPWRPGTNNLFLSIPTFNPQCSYQIQGFVCGKIWTRNRPRSPGNRDEYYSTLYLANMPLTILFICYDHVYVMVICNDKQNKSSSKYNTLKIFQLSTDDVSFLGEKLFCFYDLLPVSNKHPISSRHFRFL